MNETDETPTPVEMIDEESCGFDLYTDLVTSDVQTQFDNLKEEHAVCKKQLEEMSADYKKFKTQNKAYAEENEVLRKNISLLYLTAKSEVERKDYEIDRLRKKLQYAQSRIQELGMAQFQSNKDCSDKMGISNRLISLAYQGNQNEGDSGKREMSSPSNDSGFRSEPVQYDIAASSESKDRIDRESVNLMNPSEESHDLYCSRKKGYEDKVSGSRDRNPEKDKKSGIVTHTDSGHHAKHSEPRESHTKREKSSKPEEAGKHEKKYKTSINHSDEHLHPKRQTSRSRSRSTCSPGHSKYENDTVPRHRKAASGTSDKKARRTKTPEQVDGTHDRGGAKRHHGKVKVEEHRRVGARKRSRSGSFEENPSKHIVRSGNNIKRRRTETSTSDEKRAHDRDKSSLPDERHRRKLGNESSERKEEGEKRKSSERRLDEKHNHKEQKLVSKRKRSTDEQMNKQRRKSSEQRTKVPRNSSSKTVGKTETPAKAGSPKRESSNKKVKSSQTRSKESSHKADQHSNSAKKRSHTKEGLEAQKPASRSSSEKKRDEDRIYETGTKLSNTDKKKEEKLTASDDTKGKEKQNMLQKHKKELKCSEDEDEESGDEKSLNKCTEEHLEKEMHRETEAVNDANKLTSKTQRVARKSSSSKPKLDPKSEISHISKEVGDKTEKKKRRSSKDDKRAKKRTSSGKEKSKSKSEKRKSIDKSKPQSQLETSKDYDISTTEERQIPDISSNVDNRVHINDTFPSSFDVFAVQGPRTPSNQEESDDNIDVSKEVPVSETEGGVQETPRLSHHGPDTLTVQGVCESDEDLAHGEVDVTEMPDSTTGCDAGSVPGEDASGEGNVVTVTSSVTKDQTEEEDQEKINGEETVCGDQNSSTDEYQLQAVGVTSGEQIHHQSEMEKGVAVNGHVEVCSSGDATTQNNPDSDQIVLEFTELSAPIGSDNEFDSSFGDQAPPTPGSFMPQDDDIDDLTSSQRASSCLYEDSEDGAIPDKDLNVETAVKVEHELDVDEFDSMKETEYELSEGEILSSESDDEKEKEKRAATDRSKKSNEVRSHRRRKSQDRLDLKQSRRTSASSRNDLRSIIQKKKQTEQRRNSTSRRERNKIDVVKRTASRDRKSQIRPADRESHGRSVRDDERCRIRERSSESRKSMTDHHSDSRHRAGNGRSGGSGNIPRKESDKREGRSYTESGRNKAGVRDRDRAPSRRDSRHHRK